MAIANKMRSNREDMKEVTIVEKVLRTLTEKFNYVVVSIEESKDIDTLSIDELQSSLVVHEQKFIKPSREERALKNKCPLWDKEVNYAEFDEEEEILLMSYIDLPQNNVEKEEAWFLDSGCSNHMCGDKSKFSEMDEVFRHSVKLGNNTKMNVLGKGNVKLSINGVIFVIQDVFYVPKLKSNLLSIGQLQEKGLIIMIRSGTCNIYHPHKGLILQTNMTSNRMFILSTGTPEKKEACFNTITQNEEDKQWSWSTNNKEAVQEDLEREDTEFAKDDNEHIDINTIKEVERE
ncbi:Retrovirus-related Pol polyprotein from transposon TNT 1-94 [Sesbania bispinosa]|nr:Retrovirus-related Pol polyprotein from transposon TNT 1-94 [Sesbania bispinosa]